MEPAPLTSSERGPPIDTDFSVLQEILQNWGTGEVHQAPQLAIGEPEWMQKYYLHRNPLWRPIHARPLA